MKDKVHDWLAQQLGQQFQLDPLVALAVVAAVSATFGFLGRMAWAGCKRLYEGWRYGGWVIEVKGGKSGRHWHSPLDREVVRNLKAKNYFAFKRDLGTALSGEGQMNFSFGVSPAEKPRRREPQAPGLTIDRAGRRIVVDFAVGG